MCKISIISIKKPNAEAVRRGRTGQELIVVFSVESIVSGTLRNDKFRCTYIQEHYCYDGLPGTWGEHLKFDKVERGEIVSSFDCSGEFKIPHEVMAPNGMRYVVKAYSLSYEEDYRGDDPRFLNADEETVLKYLVEPFVEMYF